MKLLFVNSKSYLIINYVYLLFTGKNLLESLQKQKYPIKATLADGSVQERIRAEGLDKFSDMTMFKSSSIQQDNRSAKT